VSVLMLNGGRTPSSGNAKSTIHIDMLDVSQACKSKKKKKENSFPCPRYGGIKGKKR